MARKYPFRPPLKRNQYEAIGQVTAQWAYLETEIDKTILFILLVLSNGNIRAVEDSETYLIKPFKTRANQLKGLYEEIFDLPKTVTYGTKLLDQALNLKGSRDHIVHGHWHFKTIFGGQSRSDNLQVTTSKFSTSPSNRTMDFSSTKLRSTASKISKLNAKLLAFHNVYVHDQELGPPGEYWLLGG